MFLRGRFPEVVVRRGDWSWRLRPELQDNLDEIEAALRRLASNPEVKPVKKTGGRRTIWTVDIPAAGLPRVFIKHYSRPRFLKQLKHIFRNSRSRQEWEMGRALEEMGLPVARHLALAERSRHGLLQEDFLLEESLTGYRNFDAWFREEWEEVVAGAEVSGRRKIIARLAALVRQLHDQGVLQRDFKPDSIMVGPGGDFRLVDLERVRLAPWSSGLSLGQRLDNLAKIDQTFGFIGSLTDRLRFLHAYFQDDRLPPEKLHDYARRIGYSAELKFRKRARERRIWAEEDNTTYAQFTHRGFRVSAHRGLPRELIFSVIARLDRLRGKELFETAGPGSVPLRGIWCEARTALAHTPSLYHRRAPFIPARAAIYPGRGGWGFLLYLYPRPPLLTWEEGAQEARKTRGEENFGRELGRVLRIFHRMGITFREYRPDSMLYDPQHPSPLFRFYLNRLDLLLLDRSPSPEEALRILRSIQDRLELSAGAREEMEKAYAESRLRWFRAPDRW